VNARQKWRNAIRDSGLDQATRAVAWTLDTYMDGHGVAWPSKASLAVGAGCSVPTVKRAIRRLELMGFVTVRRTRGRTANTYTATLPNGATSDPVARQSTGSYVTSNGVTRDPRTRSTEQEDDRSRDQELEHIDAAMVELARGWLDRMPS
jgi:DNA-binding transcriptional MocR family regulator